MFKVTKKGPPWIKVVTELNLLSKCEHLRYIVFPMDAGKTFCYRSRMTLNGFFHGMKSRNYRPIPGKRGKHRHDRLYHIQDLEEKASHDHLMFSTLKRDIYKKVPVVYVNSIWEFYDAIGYNHKTKKWK